MNNEMQDTPSQYLGALSFLSSPLSSLPPGLTWVITKSTVTLGRAPDNDFVISDPAVSRQHARLVLTDNTWTIVKIAERNSVTVNSQEVQQADLSNGDIVGLGSGGTTFLFETPLRGEVRPSNVQPQSSNLPRLEARLRELRQLRQQRLQSSETFLRQAVQSSNVQPQSSNVPPSNVPSLIVEFGAGTDHVLQVYPLPPTEQIFNIGRDPSNTIVINRPTISGFHLQIVREGDQLVLLHPHPSRSSTVNGLIYQGSFIPGNQPFRKVLQHTDSFRISDENGAVVSLLYNDGSGQSQDVLPEIKPVPLASVISLGRAPDNTVVLNHPQVSSYHARLEQHGSYRITHNARLEQQRGGYYITDLNSTNHVYINEQRITDPYRLKPGDNIRIGPFHMSFTGTHLTQYYPGSIDLTTITQRSSVLDKAVPEETISLYTPQVQTLLLTQMRTFPYCHILMPHVAPAQVVSWLRGAIAAGRPLPLALAHDLGLLLSSSASQRELVKPPYLPFDEDTSGYMSCLKRLAAHPLVRELPTWSPPLSDAAFGVVLARLVEGLDLPQEYRWPTGPDATRFLRALEYEIAHADPAVLWEQTPVDARPSWRYLLPATALSRLERNMQALDREELRFLVRYGSGLPGGPDPRMLLDLLTLTDLPAPARLALSQTLQLVPQVSAHITQRLGGVQTYPEGGYEGLARQGSLESLLPGENVYPEEVFLHRVLNQEALYYGRERPREQRRELAYLVGQLGWGLGGDGQVLVRALLLALGQAMRQRGYEVLYSLAGATLSAPGDLEKPAEIARLLYTQESGRVNSEVVLRGVLERLRSWSGQYRGRQVLWVLSEDFDFDTVQNHTSLYQVLRTEGEQHVWYVRVGAVNGPVSAPCSAQAFGRWQMVETGRLWSHEKAGIA